MRIGLLGGAFNPPHLGHLKLARLALEHLELDELHFVPTAQSPHKPQQGGTSLEARLHLLSEALQGFDERCRVEPLELERGGISYTVDTLETLVQRAPGTAWILIMGSDQLPGLPAWHRVERIFQLTSAAVALRPGAPFLAPNVPGLSPVSRWSGSPGELVALPPTELELASSDLRDLLRTQESPTGLPPQVLRTIRSENLYR